MTTTFTLDPNHTRLGFTAKHLMVTTVRGHFKDFEGQVQLEKAGDPLTARATVGVRTASIETGVADRDNHLRSEDFFAAETYPELSYRSTTIEDLGDRRYRVTGDLTIRGTTRPVTLEVEVEGPIQDPWGNQRVGVSATGTLNRKDWGLNWNRVLEAGTLLVSDQIKLEIEAALVSRPAAVEAA